MSLAPINRGPPGPPLYIEELTGQRRKLVLQERALPYRPLKMSGEQGHSLTWYPGNPVASIQILGAREDETTIEGQWKDRFIGRPLSRGSATVWPASITDPSGAVGAVRSVGDLVEFVNDFRRQGQQVEMRWDEIQRKGIIARFEHNWLNIHDVEFSIKFVWAQISADVEVPLALTVSAPADIATRQRILGDDVQAEADAMDLANDDFLSKLKEALRNVQGAIQSVVNTAQQNIDGVLAIADTLRRFASLAEFTKAEAFRVIQQTQNQVAALGIKLPVTVVQGAGPGGLPLVTVNRGQPSAAKVTAFVAQNRATRVSARNLRGEVARQADDLAGQVGDRQVFAVIIARAGDDLRGISTRVYGTPNEWRSIATFNGLHASQLTGGEVLLVPRAGTAR
jgi:nucleoid-associated protein YgaU